jgi:hypothetical protein
MNPEFSDIIKLNKIVKLITTLLRMEDLPKHPSVSNVAPSLKLLDDMKGTACLDKLLLLSLEGFLH